MCMSPHEMTSAMIEDRIEQMKEWIAAGSTIWSWRLHQFEQVLKERADNGTYHTAGEY